MIRKLFIAPIRFYQYAISPLFGPRCKYYPSCSEYTVQAIREHGPLKGVGSAPGASCAATPSVTAASTTCRRGMPSPC